MQDCLWWGGIWSKNCSGCHTVLPWFLILKTSIFSHTSIFYFKHISSVHQYKVGMIVFTSGLLIKIKWVNTCNTSISAWHIVSSSVLALYHYCCYSTVSVYTQYSGLVFVLFCFLPEIGRFADKQHSWMLRLQISCEIMGA